MAFGPIDDASIGRTNLHGLRSILLKLLYVLLHEDHLLLQEGSLLLQSFHIAQDSGHILEGLITGICTQKHSQQTAVSSLKYTTRKLTRFRSHYRILTKSCYRFLFEFILKRLNKNVKISK